MTPKSDRHTSNDSMLCVARRSSARCAFISTSHRCVPETSAAFLLFAAFLNPSYLNVKILDVKSLQRLSWGTVAGLYSRLLPAGRERGRRGLMKMPLGARIL